MSNYLKSCIVENNSGITISGKTIPTVKNHQFKVLNTSIGGDAPKDVLQIYQYDGKIRKDNIKT